MKIAFDIDGTLWEIRPFINKDGKKDMRQVPDYDLIQVLRWFYKNGDTVYVWSAGGVEYAQIIVDKLGLTEMVTVIPKGVNKDVDIAFDDEQTSLAKVDIRVTGEPIIPTEDK